MSIDTKDIGTVNLNADTLDGKHNGEVTAKGLGTIYVSSVGSTVKEGKDNLKEVLKGNLFGVTARVGADLITSWDYDERTVVASSVYSVVNVAPQYDGVTNGQYMLFLYGANAPKLVGISNSKWTAVKTFAFTDSNVASAQKLQDSQGVYLDRATWNALVARVSALDGK